MYHAIECGVDIGGRTCSDCDKNMHMKCRYRCPGGGSFKCFGCIYKGNKKHIGADLFALHPCKDDFKREDQELHNKVSSITHFFLWVVKISHKVWLDF